MAKTVKRTTTKLKKKAWFQLVAPKSFNSVVIGETTALEPSLLMGRRTRINLMSLTRDLKHQNINITFEVDNVDGDRAITKPIAFEMISASVKRLIRRRREHIFDSFVVETKDKKKVSIKPLLITRSKADNSAVKKIRKEARDFVADYARKTDLETLFKDVTFTKLQKSIRERMSKICPLRNSEIRVLKVETRKKAVVKPKPEEKI